jgi:Mn2+/Fe2+ NRAMP family transporter
MLAAFVLPLSTAYAVCGAFGWERGVSRSWSEAPIFNGIYTALIAFAAAFVLIPRLPLIQVIVATQFLNGLLLPIVLIFVLRLVNERDLMGQYVNNTIFNILSYGTTVILILLTVALLVLSVVGGGGGG